MKAIIVATILIFLIAVTVSFSSYLWVKNKEKYYSHTLGTYGQPEPAFCYETEPVGPLNECRAGSLACSSYKSWQDLKKCEACLRDKSLCQKETISDTLSVGPSPDLLNINVP